MKKGKTKLASNDYNFLQRFLDTTKANLFFARGVILVEGESENLLLSTIAKIIDSPLNKYGVSIVNVGSKEYHKYAKIFLREEPLHFNIKVAIVSDIDVPIIEHYEASKKDLPTAVLVTPEFIAKLQSVTSEIKIEELPLVFEYKSSYGAYINLLN